MFKANFFTFLFLLSSIGLADIKSNNGTIRFDAQSDGQTDMTLNVTGLGIGVSPSCNLQVADNALISTQLFVGGSSGSSNLNVSGTLGYGIQSVSLNTNLGGNSFIMVDSSSDNIMLILPYAGNVSGRIYHIKKTSLLNTVWLSGAGNLIDDTSPIELANSASVLPSIKVISGGSQWHVLASSNLLATVASANLVGWWKLDDTSGNVAKDSSNQSNHGTLINGFTFSGNGTNGTIGRALAFDGTNDYISLTNFPIGSSFSVMAWAKSNTATWNNFGMFFSSRASNGFLFHPDPGSKNVRFYVCDSAGALGGHLNVAPADIQIWHHYAMTYDAGTQEQSVYIDGVLSTSATNARTRTSGTITAYIGMDLGVRYLNGQIDDCRIYNKALNYAEITRIFQK